MAEAAAPGGAPAAAPAAAPATPREGMSAGGSPESGGPRGDGPRIGGPENMRRGGDGKAGAGGGESIPGQTRPPALTLAQQREILHALEVRVLACERLLGDPGAVTRAAEAAAGGASRVPAPWAAALRDAVCGPGAGGAGGGTSAGAGAGGGASAAAGGGGGAERSAAALGLAEQFLRVKLLVDRTLGGKPNILHRKFYRFREWMASDHAAPETALATRAARQSYVLAHLAEIEEAGRQLRRLEDLVEYANRPSFAEACAARDRVLRLERRGAALARAAFDLQRRVEELAAVFAAAMNALGAAVALALQRRGGAAAAAKGKRRARIGGVVFAGEDE